MHEGCRSYWPRFWLQTQQVTFKAGPRPITCSVSSFTSLPHIIQFTMCVGSPSKPDPGRVHVFLQLDLVCLYSCLSMLIWDFGGTVGSGAFFAHNFVSGDLPVFYTHFALIVHWCKLQHHGEGKRKSRYQTLDHGVFVESKKTQPSLGGWAVLPARADSASKEELKQNLSPSTATQNIRLSP